MLLCLQTYQKDLIKTSSVSQQIYNWGIELEQTGNEKLMEEFWPQWELYAAQSFTTLYISDAIREGFSDDKKMYSRHEEMQILDSRLYYRKSPRFFEKSTMKEEDKQVSDA